MFPVDTACGDVLNMAMCLNVCLVVLQEVIVRGLFFKLPAGKCKSEPSLEPTKCLPVLNLTKLSAIDCVSEVFQCLNLSNPHKEMTSSNAFFP